MSLFGGRKRPGSSGQVFSHGQADNARRAPSSDTPLAPLAGGDLNKTFATFEIENREQRRSSGRNVLGATERPRPFERYALDDPDVNYQLFGVHIDDF